MPGVPPFRDVPAITPTFLALQCTRFSSWFPQYRRHTPKATLIDLLSVQADFLEWLEEDGIVLPQDSEDEVKQGSSDDSEDESASEEPEEDDVEPRRFDALNEKIRQIISTYEGAVFPKLDWSAPLDAAWIVPGTTLRCTTPSDVYMLLKSSDFVTKDVKQLRELDRMQQLSPDTAIDAASPPAGVRPKLVLKKFFSIPTSHEFRCFVRAGHLLCISQRDCGTFFEHLQDSHTKRKLRQLLHTFFQNVLNPLPPGQDGNGYSVQSPRSPFPIQDFVWDAYISRDMTKVFLVDINPYLERTDSLLWTWDEIEELAEKRNRGETISEEEEDEDDDDEDSDEGTVMRIFTDGREPMLLQADGSDDRDGPLRDKQASLPLLRTITSRAQTTQSFPTYARNMIPSEVVGAAEGNSIAEFAREWNDRIAQATKGGEELDNDINEDEAHLEKSNSMPGR